MWYYCWCVLDCYILCSFFRILESCRILYCWINNIINFPEVFLQMFSIIRYIRYFVFLLIYLYEFCTYRLIHPVKMLVGMLAMMTILGTFAYISMEGSAIHNFKRQYPVVGVLFIIFAGCFITYTLGSLLVFLFGILLPFCGKCDIWYFILLLISLSFFLEHCKWKLISL